MATAVAEYRRFALRAFLMDRRGRLRPEEVGLRPRDRARSAGLNRDDVAALAGISAYWYERFETQREAHPSDATLAAIEDALRLDDGERAYLRLLVRGVEPPNIGATCDDFWMTANAGDLTATVLFDGGYQRLRSNALFDWLFGYDPSRRALEHNALYRMFTISSRRATWDEEWERAAARMVGKVRWMCALTGTIPSIVSRMCAFDAFRAAWERHEVDIPHARRDLTIWHAEAGPLRLRVTAPKMEPGYFAGIYVPADAETELRLRAHAPAWSRSDLGRSG